MEKSFYRKYYELERQHWWFTARAEILSRYIKKQISSGNLPKEPLKILNVGCGPGKTSEMLSRFGKVTSVEYDKDCCEFTAELTGLEIFNGSITELQFDDDSFDLVCAFDVVEHVEDDVLAVAELKRVVTPNGVVLITVPAFMSLWSHHDVINYHFRRYTKHQIVKLFESASGGNRIFCSYFNFFLFPPIYLFRKVSNLLKLGEKRSGSGSDGEVFNPGFVNSLLYKLLRTEGFLLNAGISLPFGVSILYCWRKNPI